MNKEYTPAEAKAWLQGYDEGRRFAGNGLDLPLVRLDEFLTMIKGSENLRGKPVMRTAWPMEEINSIAEKNGEEL
jgi:hypothetical protein